jgi:intraflagellar transport protein 88
MIASCHRRSGNYQQALETYKHIHRKFPDNVECLGLIVRQIIDWFKLMYHTSKLTTVTSQQ